MNTVTFWPSPATVLVLKVPLPWRTSILATPVPLTPSVMLATNSQRPDEQSDENAEQFAKVLTSWHTGRVTSVTWKWTGSIRRCFFSLFCSSALIRFLIGHHFTWSPLQLVNDSRPRQATKVPRRDHHHYTDT